jgi:hypothetical protein
MIKTLRPVVTLFVPALLSVLLVACQNQNDGVRISPIHVEPSERISVGETAALTIQASGSGLAFQWSTNRGTLLAPSRPSTIYRAPSTPGLATVNVQVTGAGGSAVESKTFEIVDKPSPSLVSTSAPPAGAVTLSSHQEGQTVRCEAMAKGLYSPDVISAIWPVIYIDSRYHPQDEGGKGASKVNGNWIGTVRFGDCNKPQEATGKTFQLLVVTADEAANQAFESYIQKGMRDGFHGLRKLPAGTTEQARIMVMRD